MHLVRELPRAERMKANVSVLIVALQDLTGINRNYGHLAGDRALCEVARILRAAIRPYDVCVRYGGGEFIVVLSRCGTGEAKRWRLELQKSVDSLAFEAQSRRRVRLKIASGAATFPQDGQTYEELFAEADRRMFDGFDE